MSGWTPEQGWVPGERDTKNEAAERLRQAIREHGEPETDAELILLDAALAEERRATVERIRAALTSGDGRHPLAILDEEANAAQGEAAR